MNSTERTASHLIGSFTDAPALEIRLFGRTEVRVRGRPIPPVRTRKGLWILVLLALHAGQDVDRLWLASTLWPDLDQTGALRNLRQSLHDLRLALRPAASRLVSPTPRTLCLDLADSAVDVLAFNSALARGDAASLEDAISLYRGPLLEDCSEEWCLQERRRLERDYMEALVRTAKDYADDGHDGMAVRYLRQAESADPFRENIRRALMEALARTGDTVGAMQTYRDLRELLSREMNAAPAEETTALYRRIRENARIQSPPHSPIPGSAAETAPRSAAPQRVLPAPLTNLIGRDEAVREIESLLQASRLVTLTGTGGIGKTRLAMNVASHTGARFEDGAAFVPLAPLSREASLPEAVCDALRLPRGDGRESPTEVLLRELSRREMLLVLDNCEHVSEVCAALADALLGSCPLMRILATSRHAMGHPGETAWRVPSLALPPEPGRFGASRSGPAPSPTMYAAVQLFVERATAADSAFALTPKNEPIVAEVCRRLEGIPLAIELAAARVRALSVEDINARLGRGFGLLKAGSPVLPRHETLGAAFQWSWDLLSEAERRMLSHLSVFSGGWSLTAAEAVCAGQGIEPDDIVGSLISLVDKSLVVFGDPYGGRWAKASAMPEEPSNRYCLLATIREFALCRLEQDAAGATECREAHLGYFLSMAETTEPRLTASAQGDCLKLLDAEVDNFRAALSWCVSGCRPEQGLRLATALWRYWDARGLAQEGRQWLDAVLGLSGECQSQFRAKALNGAGVLALHQGDLQEARRLNEEALRLQRESGDRAGVARSLNELGNIASHESDYETARQSFEESLAIRRDLGDLRGVAVCLNNLGSLACDFSDYARAVELHKENLELRRAIGDVRGEALALGNMANAAAGLGDIDAAAMLYEEALALHRGLGNPRSVAITLSNLGYTAFEKQEYGDALTRFAEALPLHLDTGDQTSLATTLERAASTLLRLGEIAAAARVWGAAEQLRGQIGAPIPPDEAAPLAEIVVEAKQAAGDTQFRALWFTGREMGVDVVVDFVLSAAQSHTVL